MYVIKRKEVNKMIVKEKTIYFDMDGTIADLYSVKGWLDDLENYRVRPYAEAVPMLNMSLFARYLNKLHKVGYKLGVVSWLSKTGTEEYNERVAEIKREWLSIHLKSVQFDEIHIVEYGTPKQTVVDNPFGVLFDDEKQNRKNWTGKAFDVDDIIGVLKALLDSEM